MSIRVGVISDTHGLLRPEVVETLRSCDAILHAGDVDRPQVLDPLRQIAPLYVVRGNNDRDWNLPYSLRFSLGGFQFLMIHNKAELPKALGSPQIIVFGHSHRYFEQVIDGRLWLNPGSCGRPRFGQEISMAILELEDGAYRVEKIPLQP